MTSRRTAALVAAAAFVAFVLSLRARSEPRPVAAPRTSAPLPVETFAPVTSLDQPGVAPERPIIAASAAPSAPSGADPDTLPLADVNAIAAAALKKQARICRSGRPVDDSIANRRVVFFYTLVVEAGAGSIDAVTRVDDDLEDDRLLRCLLTRAAETRFDAKGAADVRRRLQGSFALRDLRL